MVTADLDLGLTALNASAVMGHKGWLAGYQTSFDIAKSAVTKNNFGLGYAAGDCVLHTSLTNGTEFGGSVFQKLSPALETGVTLGWSTAGAATKFGIGAKYVLADGAVVRAKVNNSSEVGLGYQQKLRDGVTVTLSTLINGANFNAVRQSNYLCVLFIYFIISYFREVTRLVWPSRCPPKLTKLNYFDFHISIC